MKNEVNEAFDNIYQSIKEIKDEAKEAREEFHRFFDLILAKFKGDEDYWRSYNKEK